MMGELTIYSAGGQGEPITLRDITNMIESVGGAVSFATAGTIDFDLDAPLSAAIGVNGARLTLTDAKIHRLSFRVSGTDG
jgi:hypothetical protein